MSGSEFSKERVHYDEDQDYEEDPPEHTPDFKANFKDDTNTVAVENRIAEDRIARFTGGPYTPFNENVEDTLLNKLARNPTGALGILKDHADPEARYIHNQQARYEAARELDERVIPVFVEKLRENDSALLSDIANDRYGDIDTPESQSAIFRTMTDAMKDMTTDEKNQMGWMAGHLVTKEGQVYELVHDMQQARNAGEESPDDGSQDRRLDALAENLKSHNWSGLEDVRNWLTEEVKNLKDNLEHARNPPEYIE